MNQLELTKEYLGKMCITYTVSKYSAKYNYKNIEYQLEIEDFENHQPLRSLFPESKLNPGIYMHFTSDGELVEIDPYGE